MELARHAGRGFLEPREQALRRFVEIGRDLLGRVFEPAIELMRRLLHLAGHLDGGAVEESEKVLAGAIDVLDEVGGNRNQPLGHEAARAFDVARKCQA